MKRVIAIVTVLTCFGMDNIVSAEELLPWQTENIDILAPGDYSVKVDDRRIFFEVPADIVTKVGRASEVITRGDKYEDWLKKNGEYQKGCFGMSWNFYPLGIPLFGSYAQFSISAKLHVKNSPASRNMPSFRDVALPGHLPGNFDRGDFSKPEEMEAMLHRYSDLDKQHTTPVDEVIIDYRKWYHYFGNTAGYPDDLNEYFITGLAPDRYLEVRIRLYPVPVYSDRYPRYAPEDQRPRWMKKAFKYKEQVINSLKITRPEGSTEPDLYEVETFIPSDVSTKTLTDKPLPPSILTQ